MVRKQKGKSSFESFDYVEGNVSQTVASIRTTGLSLTIKLFGDIPEPDDQRIMDIVDVLETPGLQQVDVIINTYGGSYDTAVMLYNMLKAMQSTTFIRTIGISSVYSAGAIIFMAGVERIAAKYTGFLIHTTRLQLPYELSSNSKHYLDNHIKTVNRIMTDIFGEHLTDTELRDILHSGRDLYLNEYEALEKRIVNHVGYVHPDQYMVIDFIEQSDEDGGAENGRTE